MENDKNLEKLGEEIAKAKGAHDSSNERPDSPASNAMKVGIELVSGVAVGSVLGLLADRWLGTSPLFFICFFILGTLGGCLNIYRLARSQKMSDKAGK